MTGIPPLFYTVKRPPPENICSGDLVHELHTDRVLRVEAINDAGVVLRSTAIPKLPPIAISREDFDAVVVFGGEGMRVFGKVTRIAP